MAIQFDNTNTGVATLKPAASGTLSLTLPSADGSANQVMATDGSGNLSFVTAAGGGALNDLTDVALVSVVDGDLLRYNGTASEWQNTNLGISIAPTLSVTTSCYEGNPLKITINNFASYDQPNFFCEVMSGTTVIRANSSFITDGNTITFQAPAYVGSYTLRVKAQDFGDLESEFTQTTLTVSAIPAARYWRVKTLNATSSNYFKEIFLYTNNNQQGPFSPLLTSATTPSPYVVTSSPAYNATYEGWKAFDNNTNTGWWNLAQTPYNNNYIILDVGSGNDVSIQSLRVQMNSTSYTSGDTLVLSSSTTGAFTGEELDIIVFEGWNDLISTIYNIG